MVDALIEVKDQDIDLSSKVPERMEDDGITENLFQETSAGRAEIKTCRNSSATHGTTLVFGLSLFPDIHPEVDNCEAGHPQFDTAPLDSSPKAALGLSSPVRITEDIVSQ